MKRIVLFAALACLLAPAFAAEEPPPKPTDAAGWSALTQRDVDAMRALVRDQTPVPYDAENPEYSRWLEEGHAAASARAAQVTDEISYGYTLTAYANGFRDPHFSVAVRPPPATRWPGFVATGRGDKVVVLQRDVLDPSAPALGAIVESCDGQTPSALVQARVLPFSQNVGLPERWFIPDLFLDRGNPFVPLSASCLVRTGDQVAEIPLQWRKIYGVPTTFGADLTNAVFGPATTWGLTEPAPGVFWIGVPTFSNTSDAIPQLRALIEAVKARDKEMRNARAIVIDTRGNFGGSTVWSNQLADAIFTPKVLRAATSAVRKKTKPARKTAVEMRASPENIAYLRKFVAGLDDSAKFWDRSVFKNRLKGLERALKREPAIWRTGSKKTSPSGGITTQRPPDAASPFPARVYLLSNGSCNSTCLILADKVLMVPGVRLIGSATAADTPHMEVRSEKLPSGLAEMSFSQMVIHGRSRGALEAYAPDIAYDGNWDDASVRAWTLSLIEAGR